MVSANKGTYTHYLSSLSLLVLQLLTNTHDDNTTTKETSNENFHDVHGISPPIFMLIAIRKLMSELDDNSIPIDKIQTHLQHYEYTKALWMITDCFECMQDDKDLLSVLLQAWELACQYQQCGLRHAETTHQREYKQQQVTLCQEGVRKVQRHLDEANVFHDLNESMQELVSALDANRKCAGTSEMLEHYWSYSLYSHALWKLTKSKVIQKDKNLLLLLERSWSLLCHYQHFRLQEVEKVYQDFCGGKFEQNARIILDDKKKEVLSCKEGRQRVSVHLEYLEGRKWTWQKRKIRHRQVGVV